MYIYYDGTRCLGGDIFDCITALSLVLFTFVVRIFCLTRLGGDSFLFVPSILHALHGVLISLPEFEALAAPRLLSAKLELGGNCKQK
ncbi:hypothetical protein T4C_2220 [Trichinella pseudospiralis]|uniref:Uncharacterized protein n=1 Tax=Trichinella pseudospiralis TaxID=6337 RepID=A0A0V1K3S6_TRIPS|nr:hypothetical protein T4C_2220 [Trichinella pseudospiralis]